MLSPELQKLMNDLENQVAPEDIAINPKALLNELRVLNDEESLQESLSLSGKVCPTCGREL